MGYKAKNGKVVSAYRELIFGEVHIENMLKTKLIDMCIYFRII